MQVNMSGADRKIRGVIAIVLLVVTFWVPALWWLFLLIAVILAITVFTGFCPLYLPLGIDTTKGCQPDQPAPAEQPVVKQPIVEKKPVVKKKK